MKVILFGATGMVGQGVLREVLLDPEISHVLSVGRKPLQQKDRKLSELLLDDMFEIASVASQLTRYDAAFFCLGVSAVGLDEAAYRRVTFDLTLAAAGTLVANNPGMTFIYVSGAGTDTTTQGRTMWARVKGATENALLQLPFRAAYMFRPGYIQPLHGARSRTPLYDRLYRVIGPTFPLLKLVLGNHVTTTEQVGRAMIQVAKLGAPQTILDNRDINAIAEASRL
jgi:uncharacterized protein YbjT (DUF2867 family)